MKKTIFTKSAIFLTLIFLLYQNIAAQTISYPIKWTTEVKLKSLSDIPKLLASKNYVGSEVDYVNSNNKHAIAKTCAEYFFLKANGYSPENNMDIGAESNFVANCDSLRALQFALPAKYSFIRNFDLQKDYVSLPAALIFPDLATLSQPPGDVKTVFPDVEVEKGKNINPDIIKDTNSNTIWISSKNGAATTAISVLGWGDFNHDGYDDMLILVANYSYDFEGSFHSYHIFAVTRKQKDSSIEQVEINSSNYGNK